MFKKTSLLLLSGVLLLSPLSFIKADGGMIPYYEPDYKDIYEPSQTALIVYDEGVEDLYIKASYEGETNKFVWIVPTPSYPEAELAPYDIFDELSIYTRNERPEQKNDFGENFTDGVTLGGTNVVVHSQEQVGIYEVTVLSATGVDGLYVWLKENNYPVKEDIKDVLDWYIEKEWYFTAMRINPEDTLNQIISDFDKKVDIKITKDNLAEELADYGVDLIVNKRFEELKKLITYLLKLIPVNDHNYDEYVDFMNWSEEESEDKFSEVQDYLEDDILEAKSRAEKEIKDWINKIDHENIDKYSDYIEPIKISFKSNSIVYPLKISQISTRVSEDFKESLKSNEVLLYVLSDNQVKAPEFNLEFNKEINRESLENFEYNYDLVYSDNDLKSLKGVVDDKDYYLTKMRRDFAKNEMDEDLYLIEGEIQNNGNIDVLLFKGDGCPHCIDANGFLYDIKDEFDINFLQYEIYNDDENKKLYDSMIEKFNIDSAGVPLIVIGDDYILGFGDEDVSGKKIIKKINNQIIKPLTESYQENTLYLDAKNKIFGSALSDRLKGRIVLKVEDDGKAYYINPTTKYSHYLGRPADAFSVMREQGIGITTDDLDNIPVALSGLTGDDTDGDGLPDKFEDAIGTNVNNSDTDGDGYSDKQELEGNYDPNQAGGVKLDIDNSFAEKQKGKILLQVENNGEAWYVNPEDGKIYFLGRPADAFQVMRNLGLGISNEDFGKL